MSCIHSVIVEIKATLFTTPKQSTQILFSGNAMLHSHCICSQSLCLCMDERYRTQRICVLYTSRHNAGVFFFASLLVARKLYSVDFTLAPQVQQLLSCYYLNVYRIDAESNTHRKSYTSNRYLTLQFILFRMFSYFTFADIVVAAQLCCCLFFISVCFTSLQFIIIAYKEQKILDIR